ncbi:MAG TPA: GNAT family N-acetyltransferase [Xanthomonadaceae bacterium]|jgi:GNAT superfamily N-acetyltransferase|nr:GNAT family N-acetyltransferase [Xanthomonadaceae bacterium]
MSIVVRRAAGGDAETLSRIATRTFIDTFGHLYPEEDLQDFLQTNYALAECERLLADERYAVWLLEDDGVAVGHASAGPCGLPHDDVTPDDGELKRLYLLPQAQNGGWGGRLFEAALDWLERDGPRTIWISVWSQNFGAQRFYARWGFSKVAEYEFAVGRVRDHEFMFRRDARPAM